MYNKIQDINIEDKKVVLRCDYNVPIVDGVIQDDTKIKASLKTIEYLLEHNCKIIILSHLGIEAKFMLFFLIILEVVLL